MEGGPGKPVKCDAVQPLAACFIHDLNDAFPVADDQLTVIPCLMDFTCLSDCGYVPCSGRTVQLQSDHPCLRMQAGIVVIYREI